MTDAKAPAQGNSAQYVWAVVIIVMVVFIAAASIIIYRPDADILVVLTVSLGFATAISTSVMSAMKAQETHLLVNSRMEKAITDATMAAFGEGMKQGRETANARTDMLADKNAPQG